MERVSYEPLRGTVGGGAGNNFEMENVASDTVCEPVMAIRGRSSQRRTETASGGHAGEAESFIVLYRCPIERQILPFWVFCKLFNKRKMVKMEIIREHHEFFVITFA